MKRFAIAIAALTCCSMLVIAADVTQWRGPDRTGVYKEKGLLDAWPDGGPKILWQANLPEAHSSMTVADGRVYTTAMDGGDGFIYCFDAEKGKRLWKTKYGRSWDARSHSGPRSTPTIAHGMVCVVSAHGKAVALDAENGDVEWTVDMPKVFGSQQIQWGISESPLVVGDKLIVTPGGTRASIAALDVKTGTVEWKAQPLRGKGGAQKSAYCSPALIEHNKRKIIVTHLADSVAAVDARTGKGLWTFPFRNKYAVHSITPQYHKGIVILAGGYRYGAVGLELSADGSKYRKAWTNKDLATHHGGLVVVDGYVYGTNDRALVCVNAKTGKTRWTDRDIGKGSVIYADGKLIFHTERGQVGLAKISPKGCEIISTFRRRLRQTRSHPVVADGRLYLRQDNTLYCYDLRAKNYATESRKTGKTYDDDRPSEASER
jgi:outer membrane protein assembly factor BamB